MIHVTVKSDLERMAQQLDDLAKRQLPFATAQALNDTARDARDRINAAMPEIFDRPISFTRRAVVAPKELAATKDRLAAVVTLRPIQAQYLLHEEIGGTRSPSENTRKPAQAVILPGKAQKLNAYGNIPSGTLARLRQLARPGQGGHDKGIAYLPPGSPANRSHIGGYFRRLAGHGLARLTAFKPDTHYRARFGFTQRVHRIAAEVFAKHLKARLAAAIRTAK